MALELFLKRRLSKAKAFTQTTAKDFLSSAEEENYSNRSMSSKSEKPLVLMRRSTSFGSKWNTICPLIRFMKSEALRPAASAGVPGLTVLTFNNKIYERHMLLDTLQIGTESYFEVAFK